MFATNPELQIEIEALAKVLRDLPVDQIASYEMLSEAAGYSVQRKPFALMRARKKVETETGLRFATARKEGVKKLSGAAVVGIGAEARKRIARTARRQATRLTALRYNDIDAKLQARIDAERSLLGAISAVANTNSEAVAENTSTGPMVAARVFEMVKAA